MCHCNTRVERRKPRGVLIEKHNKLVTRRGGLLRRILAEGGTRTKREHYQYTINAKRVNGAFAYSGPCFLIDMLSVREFLQAAMGAGSLPESKAERFTGRERQVLSYVFEGLINKEIAGGIGVSESSVKATLQQLFSKTGVRTRSQLVRVALEQYRNQL